MANESQLKEFNIRKVLQCIRFKCLTSFCTMINGFREINDAYLQILNRLFLQYIDVDVDLSITINYLLFLFIFCCLSLFYSQVLFQSITSIFFRILSSMTSINDA